VAGRGHLPDQSISRNERMGYRRQLLEAHLAPPAGRKRGASRGIWTIQDWRLGKIRDWPGPVVIPGIQSVFVLVFEHSSSLQGRMDQTRLASSTFCFFALHSPDWSVRAAKI